MTTPNPDTDTLVPDERIVTLVSGSQVRVLPIKLRQLLRLLKILAGGAGSAIQAFSADESDEDVATSIMFALVLAIPEAEDETVDFIQSVVLPAGYVEGRRLSKQQQKDNDELIEELAEELFNPELEDSLAIIENIVKFEAPHIRELGKKLKVLFDAQTKSTEAKAKSKAAVKKSSAA
jgi:hypothetical protein